MQRLHHMCKTCNQVTLEVEVTSGPCQSCGVGVMEPVLVLRQEQINSVRRLMTDARSQNEQGLQWLDRDIKAGMCGKVVEIRRDHYTARKLEAEHLRDLADKHYIEG